MAENPRIDVVEKEVKKLKVDVENVMELKNTIDDLNSAVLDIRALMSRAQNPFDLLHFVTDEDELNKLIQARQLVEKKFVAKKGPETTSGGKVEGKASGFQTKAPPVRAGAVGKSVGFVVESRVEDKDVEETRISENQVEKGEKIMETVQPENRAEGEEEAQQIVSFRDREATASDLRKGISIIHWIYRMLDLGFDERSIQRICDYCEFFCYMPKGYSEHVSSLVGAIIRARSCKLSPEVFMLSVYSAAEAVGVQIDSKDLSGLIIQVLEKCKANESIKSRHTSS